MMKKSKLGRGKNCKNYIGEKDEKEKKTYKSVIFWKCLKIDFCCCLEERRLWRIIVDDVYDYDAG